MSRGLKLHDARCGEGQYGESGGEDHDQEDLRPRPDRLGPAARFGVHGSAEPCSLDNRHRFDRQGRCGDGQRGHRHYEQCNESEFKHLSSAPKASVAANVAGSS